MMKSRKLLIVTQKVSKNDPVLGFFVSWIEELSKQFESIIVICLEKGEYNLPDNVKVYSLGKENGGSRILFARRFYALMWKMRDSYNAVFVHMNQEYVLLGGLFWRSFRKKIFLWRNHPQGNILTRIAVALSHRVYATSAHSYTSQFKKCRLMPGGINMQLFKNMPTQSVRNSVIYVGRLSPIKQIDVLIKAAKILFERGIDARISIVGNPSVNAERYVQKIRNEAVELEKAGVVKFSAEVSPRAVPELLCSHEIAVNLTRTGSFDKTVLEAFACERIVVLSNRSFEQLIPSEYRDIFFFGEGDAAGLARNIEEVLMLPEILRKTIGSMLREAVAENHSLEKLGELITEDISLELRR